MKPVIYIITLSIFLAPASAYAEWYWLTIPEDPTIGEFTELSAVEYAVTSIPKDQLQLAPESVMEALDKTKSSEVCGDEYDLAVEELREFDATHELYTYTYYKGSSVPFDSVISQETIDARASLFNSIERGADNCLVQEQKALDGQAKKEAEARRQVEVKEAVEDCDLDFFENEMTNEERMDTWNERQSCLDEVTPDPLQDTPVTPVIIKEPAVPVVTPIPVQTSIPTPVVTPNQALETRTETITEEEATTTEFVSIEKQPEPKDYSETEVVTESVPKQPSFFKRVANFFSRLFSW